MRMIVKRGKVPKNPDSYRSISFLEVPGEGLRKSPRGAAPRLLGGKRPIRCSTVRLKEGEGHDPRHDCCHGDLSVHKAEDNKCNHILRDVIKAFSKV